MAQDQEATIFFRDGTSLTGYGEILRENKIMKAKKEVILFRLDKNEQPDEWDGEIVDRIELYSSKSRTFQFVQTVESGETTYKLLELLSEGEVNLYADLEGGFKDSYLNLLNYTRIQDFSGVTDGYTVFTPEKNPTVTHHYVKRANESKLTMFLGNKKRIGEYFNNCPGIVERLKTKEFMLKNLEQIVEYYNDFCAEGSQDSDFED